MTRWTSLAVSIVALTLPTIATAQQNSDGYSPAARRMFNMVADCPAGGTKDVSDQAKLQQKTQLRETERNGQVDDSKMESVYDLQRTTENKCK